VSESPGDGQPEGSSPPKNNSGQPKSSDGQPKTGNGQPRSGSSQPKTGNSRPKSGGTGQPRSGGTGQPRSGNGQPGGSRGPSRGSDPVADFQRWLMKAGARSMANQVADQVKRTIGAERRDSGDVWDTATNELPPNEPPECQWCPVCQAARAARTGGAAGLGAQLASAGGVLASVVGDAFSAFEQAMKTQDQNQNRTERSGSSRPDSSASDPGDTGQ
jgi:hypothetical protein